MTGIRCSVKRARQRWAALRTCMLILVVALGLSPHPALASDWLVRVNELRATGSLAPVTENSEWSEGCWLHSRYMAENYYVGHAEDPTKPWYSVAGAAAAAKSNCFLGVGGIAAIDGWMRTPFHGIGMIDPDLDVVGFGTYTKPSGTPAAALDVIRGLGQSSAPLSYPVYWPANGQMMPFLTYWGSEYPDPLAGSGYTGAVGAPIFLQIGAGGQVPVVSSSSLRSESIELQHLVLTETTYSNADATAQSLGRSVLGSRDGVVLMPRSPLLPGKRYDVTIVCNGVTYSWWFNTPPNETTLPTVPTGITATPQSSTSIHVSWNASSDASGIKHYLLYVNGAPEMSVPGTSVTVSGLSPSTTYSFYVKAVDGALSANTSAASATVTVTTDESSPVTVAPIYRFYRASTGTHFYTADAAEMARVRDTMSSTYGYEGVGYSINTSNPANSVPLYRLYNRKTGTHLYTADVSERNTILATLSNTYSLDGVAYNVSMSSGTQVFRFYSPARGVHFYSSDPSEIAYVRANLRGVWSYEGPAYLVGQ